MTRTGRLAAAGLVAATLALAGGTVAEAASGSYNPDTSSSNMSKSGDDGAWTKGGDSGAWTKGDNSHGEWSKGDNSHGEWPKGAPHTGDGASVLSSTNNIATGTTLAAAGLGIGALVLRRRRAAQSN